MRRNLLYALVAIVFFLGAATGARAADLTAAAGLRSGWEGVYLGVLGAYDDTNFDWHESNGLGNYDGNINSFSGGLFGGYNFAAGPLILGVEGEASLFTGDENFDDVPGPGRIDAGPDWQFGLKGRAGYDAGMFLPYVAVGYSWMKLDSTWPNGGPSGGDIDVSETHQGVMAGVGTDIAFTEHAFARLEYMHMWLSEERYTYCSPNCNADIKLGQNSFRFGLGYRF